MGRVCIRSAAAQQPPTRAGCQPPLNCLSPCTALTCTLAVDRPARTKSLVWTQSNARGSVHAGVRLGHRFRPEEVQRAIKVRPCGELQHAYTFMCACRFGSRAAARNVASSPTFTASPRGETRRPLSLFVCSRYVGPESPLASWTTGGSCFVPWRPERDEVKLCQCSGVGSGRVG